MPAAPATAHRFDAISTAPPDVILGLTDAFNQDTRTDKMNLSVGVYKDADGTTSILKCVKAAERALLDGETTKGYLSIEGLPDYRNAVRALAFGDAVDDQRIVVTQTPGGTGAVRVAADFLASQCFVKRVFIPLPTWANHNSIIESAGMLVETYRYLASDKKSLDFDGLIDDLQNKTQPGDAILLHACCHNPTGVDLTLDQWEIIGTEMARRGLIPLLDFAYQGFGDGIDEDAQSIATILKHCDEAIVCSSFSKNFGLYSERVGAVSLVAGNAAAAKASHSQIKRIVRSNYSNPPRHGAAIVATVLADAELTKHWRSEVDAMRTRIMDLRKSFVAGMRAVAPDHDFSFLMDQKGMFSFSGLNAMQVDQLRTEHGVYIVGSGRINVAGMNENRMEWLCGAIGSVL